MAESSLAVAISSICMGSPSRSARIVPDLPAGITRFSAAGREDRFPDRGEGGGVVVLHPALIDRDAEALPERAEVDAHRPAAVARAQGPEHRGADRAVALLEEVVEVAHDRHV